MLNAYWEPLSFQLPPPGDGSYGPWRRWIDTGLDSPHDIVPWQTAPPVQGNTYPVADRAVVMLSANKAR
jgi:glycogen operon protein